jgi:CRP/FNR family transcriptional regulator
MASRFSEVMWLIEQLMWKSFDKRLAQFLVEETLVEDTDVLKLTHEKIANHLGTAREVVSRMLKYFEGEGLVMVSRGSVKITDLSRLRQLYED